MSQRPLPFPIGLRAKLAGYALELAAIRLQLLLRKANFNPAQLRIPAGQPGGGQWTSDGGGGDASERPQPAQGRRLFGQRRPVPVPPAATIRNKDLAGKKHPETGIPFDKDGFPDFSGVATKSVRVPHTGGYRDILEANRAAGFASTPDGMVWHHHQDGHTMQLVPERIHQATGHTGSRGIGNLPGRKR
jgi:hypothetical protein